MEDVRQPAPVLLRRGHIDPDQQPSSSRGEGLSIAKADKMWPFDAR